MVYQIKNQSTQYENSLSLKEGCKYHLILNKMSIYFKHVIHLKNLLKWYILYRKQAPFQCKKSVNFKGPSSGWKIQWFFFWS